MTTKRFTITGGRSISDHQKKRLYDLSDFDGMISVTERLNELYEKDRDGEECYRKLLEKYDKLKEENEQLRKEKECDKQVFTKKQLHERLQQTRKENEQLKIRFNEEREIALKFGRDIDTLTVQNKQLQARNDRQAKRLAELYELMVKKDWESLTEIIDDFCSCEEQLQREWRTYE